jgi:hypothetical protein
MFSLMVLHQAALLSASAGDFLNVACLGPADLEEKNVFITCDASEDIPYLVQHLGENVLVAGTDYGHNDAGSELGVHSSILGRRDLDPIVGEKIVDINGRRLYGINRDFLPAPSSRRHRPPHVRAAGAANAPALM